MKNSLVQINSKLNSKPYDYQYKNCRQTQQEELITLKQINLLSYYFEVNYKAKKPSL